MNATLQLLPRNPISAPKPSAPDYDIPINSPADLERIASPHSQEAEEAVIGCMLIHPATILEIMPILKPADFFIVRHQWIYDAMLFVHQRDGDFDDLTLAVELRARNQLEDVGGAAHLALLVNRTPTHIHAGIYAGIVQRASTRRKYISASTKIVKLMLTDNTMETSELAAEVGVLIRSVDVVQPSSHRAMSDIASSVLDEIMAAVDGKSPALATGFYDLDKLLGGGAGMGDLVVIAARPGMGKSAMALCMARDMAHRGKQIGFFSLEMTANQLVTRAVAIESGVDAVKLRTGKLDSPDLARITDAIARLGTLPIMFDSPGQVGVQHIIAQCRKMAVQGLDAVFIDYLGLLAQGDEKYATTEIERIAGALKGLATELNIPIFLLAQLNREVDKRADKRPLPSDLRQSGGIEQAADTVMFIYRDDYYNLSSAEVGRAEIIVAKQRNGPTGKATLGFNAVLTKFYNPELKRTGLSNV